MSTVVEHVEDPSEKAYDAHSDRIYLVIAFVLAVLTALEVSLSYVNIGINTIVLFVLMAIKFVLVVLYFMHLKFDSKIFSYLFWSGFVLALAVYIGALACFQMFNAG